MSKPTRARQLGVTDEHYHALLDAQDGGCAICGATPKTRRLHVDHDHKTGLVRGLLCQRCNRALPGWMTQAWLLKAYAHLGASEPGSAHCGRCKITYNRADVQRLNIVACLRCGGPTARRPFA
jgi:hypothetical protein